MSTEGDVRLAPAADAETASSPSGSLDRSHSPSPTSSQVTTTSPASSPCPTDPSTIGLDPSLPSLRTSLPSLRNIPENEKDKLPAGLGEEEAMLDPPPGEGIKMQQSLGLWNGVGIIVGIIVGSGIFVSPTGVLRYSGSVAMSLVVWGVSGVLSLVGALCYAELGEWGVVGHGAGWVMVHIAYGSLPAFLYLWVALVIIMPTGNTVIALTFANYILQPFFAGCAPPDTAIRLLAACVICFLTWVNCTNVDWATKVQDVFTVAKIIALIIIIVAGVYHLSTGHTENYQHPFEGTIWEAGAIATAFYQGLFSFAGWNYLNFVVEELQNPYRNLPLAILISLPLVTLIYFLVNVAYFAVLTPAEILASNAVAVSFGDRMLGKMAWLMPLFVACSTFGSLNGGIFASSRLFFVGARQGHLPQALGLIHVRSLTPVPALLFLGAMTVFMLITVEVEALINYISFTESLFILVSISALLYMRWRHPHLNRPIRVWLGFPIVFLVVCVFLVATPVVTRPVELGVAVAVLLTGVPVYYCCVRRRSRPAWLSTAAEKLTFTCQVLCRAMPEHKRD
ncbi:Y+L amino acid transporter 2 [Hyalella azteca]|uniref:Y+L amino acid transporter 2 n=2 Tax=Hyalella azteca TaxID=294128 RepID=A0A979FMW9_HYAAZ|nr:Y+L amino acid transporter 2 [Hyalella azteca]